MDLKLNGNWCPNCSSEVKYSNQYDAYYCELCNKWLEEQCSDSDCSFCSKRPDLPSQIE